MFIPLNYFCTFLSISESMHILGIKKKTLGTIHES